MAEVDDDYVISLLLRDAERHQQDSKSGHKVTSRRPDAPKPNLRFLKNILRDADSHNAALKAKEQEESKALARDLRKSISNERKRSRPEDDGVGDDRGPKRPTGPERKDRWKAALSGLADSGSSRPAGRRRKHENKRETGRGNKHGENGGVQPRKKAARSSESRSPTRRKSFSRHDEQSTRNHRDRSRQRHSRARPPSPRRSKPSAGTSDCLESSDEDATAAEDAIGPNMPPKIKPRGRGAANFSANVDDHFREDYDPRNDVQSEDKPDDDWDVALKAVRKRTEWKLLNRGQISATTSLKTRFPDTGKDREKNIEDVRWRPRGADREWDRGKVLNDAGEIDTKPAWNRGKDE